MKCYIYFIINQITKERYVGQTTNFSRRKSEHLIKLAENRHPNPKLQAAWNKYGEENFIIQKIQFDELSKEELDEQERTYIKLYNSYQNGYNLTEGGTGGDTRSKLNFEQFCLAYFGNLTYPGMTNRTAKLLNADSSTISSIVRKQSYDKFRGLADELSEEEKQKYIQNFRELTNLDNKPAWIRQPPPEEERLFQILCVCSTYGHGSEAPILRKFGYSKGLIYHLMTGNGRQELKLRYKNTPKEIRQEIGRQYFKEWELQKYASRTIKESYKDLISYYKVADQKAP